jgi:hypothetical protein
LFAFFIGQYLQTYKGYFAPTLNSIFHGGDTKPFHSEICLFQTKDKLITKGRYNIVYKQEDTNIIRAFCSFNTTPLKQENNYVEYKENDIKKHLHVYVPKTKNIIKCIKEAYEEGPTEATGSIETPQQLTEKETPVSLFDALKTDGTERTEEEIKDFYNYEIQEYSDMITSMLNSYIPMEYDDEYK